MSILTLGEAYEKGMVMKGTKIAMPVDSMQETEVPEFLSGVKGGYPVKTETDGRLLDRCVCTVISKPKEGYISLVGETMPIDVTLKGHIGISKGILCLDYVLDELLGFSELGIAVHNVNPKEMKKCVKKGLLPIPKKAWRNYHWLSSRFVEPYSSSYCRFGLQYAYSSGVSYSNTYYYYSGSASSNSPSNAVRPIYNLPTHLSEITILADESHDGKSEETAFIVQGPGMPKIA